MNRHRYMVVGFVLLIFGLQLRFVESYVLTPRFTKFLAEQTGHPMVAVNSTVEMVSGTSDAAPAVKKTLHPPDWIGWAILSFGGVLVFHAFALPGKASG